MIFTNRKISALFVVLALVVSMTSCSWAEYYDEGHSGSATDPYIIDTNADLVMLRDRVNKGTESADFYYKLGADLNISQTTDWEAIGTDSHPFSGHFDGNNFSIHVNISRRDGIASLFGTVSALDYVVKNLKVSGNLDGRYSAGIANKLNNGTIDNCSFSGTMSCNTYWSTQDAHIGGIVQSMTNGEIKNCTMSGTINESAHKGNFGGIVATMTGGTIDNCKVEGSDFHSPQRTESYVGGIVGSAQIADFEAIKNCTFSGTLESVSYAGGIVGYISGGNLENNHVTANNNASSVIDANSVAGGIAGRVGETTVLKSCDVSGLVTVMSDNNSAEGIGGIVGVMNNATVQDNISYAIVSSDATNKGGIIGKLDSASYTIENNGYANAEHGIGINAQGVPGEQGCYKLTPPISITTDSNLDSADAGFNYSVELKTDAASGTSVTWSLTGGTSLPDGLNLDSSTGKISGTPTTAGKYTFTIQALSGTTPATKDFSLTVRLVINTESALPAGVIGQQYNQQLSATGARNVTWSLAQGSKLPSGLSLTNGRISGLPSEVVTAAQFTIIASATSDTTITASKTFTITITGSSGGTGGGSSNPTQGGIVTITTRNLPNGTVNQDYNATLESDTAGVTWSILSGKLPDGLTLANNGKISGKPTTAGTSNFKVRAMTQTASGDQALSIVINPAQGGQGDGQGSQGGQGGEGGQGQTLTAPVIMTEDLEYAYYGEYYYETLLATGENITWSITSGYLPDNLTLDPNTGVISGYVYDYEDYYSFTVKAENSAGSNTQDLYIYVYDEPYYDDEDSPKSSSSGGGGGCNSGLGIFGLAVCAAALIFKRAK